MVGGYTQGNLAQAAMKKRSGMTLVEALIASALVLLMGVGLFAVGIRVRRFGEHSRIATEAQGLGKQKLEELIAAGRTTVANPSYLALCPDTNFSTLGYPIVRVPRVIWHSATGGVVAASNGIYAEVHVDARYLSPLFQHTVTDTFTMLIR